MTHLAPITVDVLPRASVAAVPQLPTPVRNAVLRMFQDPALLDTEERSRLLQRLRECVNLEPERAELRVVLGMALCVDLDPEAGLAELRHAVQLDPDSFIARLKLGELLMRLRICREAEMETHQARRLASNPVQIDLARRQAATIGTMLQQGIERGGYKSPWTWLAGLLKRRPRGEPAVAMVNVS